MIKAVIFDMDGVIIDSEPIHRKVEKRIFEELGIIVTDEEHNSYVGMTSKSMWSQIKKKHNCKKEFSVEELIELEVDTFIESLLSYENIGSITGVVEFIDELHRNGIKLALASSAVRRSIETVVNMFKLQKYFEIRTSGEDIKKGKPCPDIFLLTAKHLNINPNECVVVEDSRNGVKATKAAGMKCIGFKNSNSGDQDLSSADIVISSFSEINFNKIKHL